MNSYFLRKVRQNAPALAGRFAGMSCFPMIPRSRDRADRKGPAAMKKSPKAGRQRMHVSWHCRPENGFGFGHFKQVTRDFAGVTRRMAEQKATNVTWHAHNITREDRQKLNGHRGAVLWFTGSERLRKEHHRERSGSVAARTGSSYFRSGWRQHPHGAEQESWFYSGRPHGKHSPDW
jgi:hypothetical protein